MSIDSALLIDGYQDDVLTAEQHVELSAWIKASPENALTFAAAAMLHDRLRNEMMSDEQLGVDRSGARENSETFDDATRPHPENSGDKPGRRSARSFIAVLSTVSLICIAGILFFKSFGDSSASAAVSELNRLIELSAKPMDRTYRITVEETLLPRRSRRDPAPEDGRPPKAPMDGATLYARDGQQFVLSRITDAGPFVTGSNGKVSWAVRPEGPVRFSKDLNQFNRDLPGHEHDMSLVNIHDGLERLRQAYDVQLLPVEDAESSEQATRLLIAIRHPKERGPKRVEISYEVKSGLIRQMRFIEMPYGPESLTLRLTLLAEESLDEHFFHHESHHNANRSVEAE